MSKYLKLDQEQIRKDFPEVFKKYEGEHMVTAVLGTRPNLQKLAKNESVCWGDGKSFHFKLTKL
jgi:hypothetical protein